MAMLAISAGNSSKLLYSGTRSQNREQFDQATQIPSGRSGNPSERDLGVSYGCNFLTVRKALKRLVDDGSIIRRVGSGTFIAKHPATHAPPVSPHKNRIGLLVYQRSNAYAYRVLQSIAHASIELSVDLRSIWVRDFGETAVAQTGLLQKDGCSALVLPWFPHEMVGAVRSFVMHSPLPACLPLLIPGLEKNCFEDPDIFGTSSTTMTIDNTCRYYQALGHQRIALLGPDSANDLILQRKITGYVHYTSRENLPSLCGLVGPGAQAMDQLAERWKAHRGDLAIISYDDEHALRFMTAMHKIGLTAPDDYDIIGYNDTEGSSYSDPPLSTIHQNFDYIGLWLLKNALALSEGKVCQSPETPRLKMLVRDSCGGRGKITDAFRSQFEYVDIAVDNLPSRAPVPEPSPLPEVEIAPAALDAFVPEVPVHA
jgi:DNA-binding transcriptional regulator YhcF (GntR family)